MTSLVHVDSKKLRNFLMFGGTTWRESIPDRKFYPVSVGCRSDRRQKRRDSSIAEGSGSADVSSFFPDQKEKKEWEHSRQGLSLSEFLVQMMLPELDGSIEMLPVAALSARDYDEELQLHIKELQLIEEGAQRLVSRVRRYLELQTKPPAEKRIAIIGYNYPPGEGHLLQASFLDIFESVSRIMKAMKQHGYMTETYSGTELRERFIQEGVVNPGIWTDERGSDS
nr:cobaltochelatase subunit CobN [Paenibacillus sp. CECT 9249]